MAGLAAIQLVTPPALFDADVLLRLVTAAVAGVLVVLSSVLSPVLIVWLLAAVLVGQVIAELEGHEGHSGAAATDRSSRRARPARARARAPGRRAARAPARRAPIFSTTISRWMSPTSATGEPSSSTTRSSGRSPASAAGEPSTTCTTSTPEPAPEPSREPRRQRPRAAGDPEVGAPEAALRHQRADDLPRRVVDGHREPEADARDRGVDADDASASVGERAARVARVQRRVGLDHVVDDPAAPGRQRAPERRDDARGDRAGEPVRVADRDHELADPQPLGVAQLGGDEVVRLGPKHGEVGVRVGADDVEAQLAAVDERGAAGPRRALDHVRRGEQEPVRRDHHRAAAAGPPAARDAEVRHRRREPLGDRDHGARVGVERFFFRRDERQFRPRAEASNRVVGCGGWPRSRPAATAAS